MKKVQYAHGHRFIFGLRRLTQGLRDAGFTVGAAVEIDALAAETYAANHPEVRLFQCRYPQHLGFEILDACGIATGNSTCWPAAPMPGFFPHPTQQQRERMDDPRNRLIDEVLRVVGEMRPKVVMLENVPNLTLYPLSGFQEGSAQAWLRNLRSDP